MKTNIKKIAKTIVIILITALLLFILSYYVYLFFINDKTQKLISLTSIISFSVTSLFVVYQVNKNHENEVKLFQMSENKKLITMIKKALVDTIIINETTYRKYINFKISIDSLINAHISKNGFVGQEELNKQINQTLYNDDTYDDEKSNFSSACDLYEENLINLKNSLNSIIDLIDENTSSENDNPIKSLIKNFIISIDKTRINITNTRIQAIGFLKSSPDEKPGYLNELNKITPLIDKECMEMEDFCDLLKKYKERTKIEKN